MSVSLHAIRQHEVNSKALEKPDDRPMLCGDKWGRHLRLGPDMWSVLTIEAAFSSILIKCVNSHCLA